MLTESEIEAIAVGVKELAITLGWDDSHPWGKHNLNIFATAITWFIADNLMHPEDRCLKRYHKTT